MELFIVFLPRMPVLWSVQSNYRCSTTNHVGSILMSMCTKITDAGDTTERSLISLANPAVCSNFREKAHVVGAVRSKIIVDRGDFVSYFLANFN